MRSIQEKWLARIEAAVPEGFEVVHKPQYANTGTLYIQSEDSFDPEAVISYNFQDAYASFDRVEGLFTADFSALGAHGYVTYTAHDRHPSLEEVTHLFVAALGRLEVLS